MRNAVLDTNVVVSAVLNPNGIPAAIVDASSQRKYRPILCTATMHEYKEVLRRPKFPITELEINLILAKLRRNGRYVTPSPQPERFTDMSDKVFWDLAVTADASVVTGNIKHFPDDQRVRTPRQFHDELCDA
ncbi:putative toxin-antitoxin system toxin component, PIN family [Bifidobacterium eulemuris]|uniref:Putative toxin-antitoxin system toxin component, PIN family n=1 Tax=Bifidobacterium eulemuris TaxID=1765219 RepID=A0A261G9N0_9BIFI|nr:putative toxin-antitoxin system toxin component, PIN family [Bifidobacterium eulemuris]OZG68137.1 toxin-antitoxin system toxin component PIN family [Bifidobacterium eulemuris]QOL31798.1 putative toxin-antitoxin system toxin component, PIN family [Bifidobacterium eulemuris]